MFIFHFSPKTKSGQKAEENDKAHQPPFAILCGVCSIIFNGCDHFSAYVSSMPETTGAWSDPQVKHC